MSGHYPANRWWEYSNLSVEVGSLDLTPNSHSLFTSKCAAAEEENLKSYLGS